MVFLELFEGGCACLLWISVLLHEASLLELQLCFVTPQNVLESLRCFMGNLGKVFVLVSSGFHCGTLHLRSFYLVSFFFLKF